MSKKMIDEIPKDMKVEEKDELGRVVFDTSKYNVIYERGSKGSGKTTNLINNMCLYLDKSSTSRRVVWIVDSVLHVECLTKKIAKHMDSRYKASKSNPGEELFIRPTGDEWSGISAPIFEYDSGKSKKIRVECLCLETGLTSSVIEIISMLERDDRISHSILILDMLSSVVLSRQNQFDLVILDDVNYTISKIAERVEVKDTPSLKFVIERSDNVWISGEVVRNDLLNMYSTIRVPYKRILYQLVGGIKIGSVLVCDCAKKLMSLLDDISINKYIVCDDASFNECTFKYLCKKYGNSNCVRVDKNMKYEDIHVIVNKLKDYKIIISDSSALSGVDIEGEYVCICVHTIRLPLLMKHNLLNSLMRVKNAEKLYVFDFEE